MHTPQSKLRLLLLYTQQQEERGFCKGPARTEQQQSVAAQANLQGNPALSWRRRHDAAAFRRSSYQAQARRQLQPQAGRGSSSSTPHMHRSAARTSTTPSAPQHSAEARHHTAQQQRPLSPMTSQPPIITLNSILLSQSSHHRPRLTQRLACSPPDPRTAQPLHATLTGVSARPAHSQPRARACEVSTATAAAASATPWRRRHLFPAGLVSLCWHHMSSSSSVRRSASVSGCLLPS